MLFKRLTHQVLVCRAQRTLHRIAGQPHLFGHIVYRQHSEVRRDGTNAVNPDLTAFVQYLFLFHYADGVKMIGGSFAHIVSRPGKHMGLNTH